MNPLQKYTWLIETIRRAGKITHKDLSDRWERNKELSDGKPLSRATFNRWRDAIFSQFGIIIDCQRVGGYLYYISNPEDIDDDKLKKWMLDSFAVGNVIGENLSMKDRIIVDEIPSGRHHLTAIIDAMKENRVLNITYRHFKWNHGFTFAIHPYCLKLFENRWYVLAFNPFHGETRIYGLDRIEKTELGVETFRLPANFSAMDYFSHSFGIVVDSNASPERVVVRANKDHKYYLTSLPLHHSQRMLNDCGEYADFEFFLVPTYDFIMRLLHVGPMVEVLEPATLRDEMRGWIAEMEQLYRKN